MKKALRDKLRATLLQTLQRAADGSKTVDGIGSLSEEIAANALAALKNLPHYRKLERDLQSAPDDRFEAIKANYERTLTPYLRKVLAEISKRLPHAPGGRPRSLTDEQRKDVCNLVLRLIGSGTSERAAISEVAERYRQQASRRTIERAWAARTNLSPRRTAKAEIEEKPETRLRAERKDSPGSRSGANVEKRHKNKR